jgi:hypothetical protein
MLQITCNMSIDLGAVEETKWLVPMMTCGVRVTVDICGFER